MTANFDSSRSSYKRSHSRRITPDDSMAALLPSITARINHLKTLKRAGMADDSFRQCYDETRTATITAITNYPRAIPPETARALISSVVEDVELFSIPDRIATVESVNSKIVESVNYKICQNSKTCHSTTRSTTVSVWACVCVCACVLAYMRLVK